MKSIILYCHFYKHILFIFILTSLPHKSCWFQDQGSLWSLTLNTADWERRLHTFQVNLSVIASIFFFLYNTHLPGILKFWIRNMSGCWWKNSLLFLNSLCETFFQIYNIVRCNVWLLPSPYRKYFGIKKGFLYILYTFCLFTN